MSPISLKLETVNSYEHPKQLDLLTRELNGMSCRLEDEPDYLEEEAFLVHAFEGDYQTEDRDSIKKFYREALKGLSSQFPDLLFALNVHSAFDEEASDKNLLRREYFKNGTVQIVTPFIIVPDFDPTEGERW